MMDSGMEEAGDEVIIISSDSTDSDCAHSARETCTVNCSVKRKHAPADRKFKVPHVKPIFRTKCAYCDFVGTREEKNNHDIDTHLSTYMEELDSPVKMRCKRKDSQKFKPLRTPKVRKTLFSEPVKSETIESELSFSNEDATEYEMAQSVTASSDSEYSENVTQEYVNGDQSMPIYSTAQELLPRDNIIRLLLEGHTKICRKIPNKCFQNAQLIIHTNNIDDVKADNMGRFKNLNSFKDYVRVQISHGRVGEIQPCTKAKFGHSNVYEVTRTYYKHIQSNGLCHKRVVSIFGSDGPVANVFVQYRFNGDVLDESLFQSVRMKTKPSVVKRIADLTKEGKSSNDVMDILYEEAGGEFGFKDESSVPRTLQQVEYYKSKKRDTKESHNCMSKCKGDKDIIYMMLKEMKCEVKGEKLVRSVETTDGGFNILLCSDKQISEVKKFCCGPNGFSILSIDTVFNCGNFYATPTTYENPNYIHHRTRRPVTCLGPVLISSHRNALSFNYFGSKLVALDKDLGKLKAIGRDRDAALRGFSQNFPFATEILCRKHIDDDLLKKMSDLGFAKNMQHQYIEDIFGNPGQIGLADSMSARTFEENLDRLKHEWDSSEANATGKKAMFHEWFTRTQSRDFIDSVIYPIRKEVGLGFNYFYNNRCESLNNKLKSSVNYKRTQLKEFIDTAIRKLLKEEETNKIRAIFSKGGRWHLGAHLQHLSTTAEEWTHMDEEMRKTRQRQVDNMPVPDNDQWSSMSVPDNSQDEDTAGVASTDLGGASAYVGGATADLGGASADVGKGRTSFMLSFEESGLSHIHLSSWDNALKLASEKEFFTPAPGMKDASLVRSFSGDNFYLIKKLTPSRYSCNCLSFKEKELCSHTIAIAHVNNNLVDYISYVNRCLGPNIQTTLNLPQGSMGKKPHQKPRRRNHKKKADRDPTAETQPAAHEIPKFRIKWLRGTKVRTCYGCHRQIENNPVPEPPSDICIAAYDYRSFFDKKQNSLKVSIGKEDCHFHIDIKCVLKRYPDFNPTNLYLSDVDKERLLVSHIAKVAREFSGVKL